MIKVLVPVDFSKTSEKALAYACQMFGSSQIEVTVLHIFGTHSTALVMKNIDSILVKDAKQEMKNLLDRIKPSASHVEFKTQIVKNYAVKTIVNYGNSDNYDLIVMGTKGASGLKEVFLGSIAGGVITKTNAPVIVVPSEYELVPPKQIVFALNDTEILKNTNVEVLNTISSVNDSSVIALHVAKGTEDEVSSDKINYGGLTFKVENIQGSGHINEDINSYLSENHSDLLCLIRSKKDLFTRVFNDSVTLKQTFSSSLPLLILHEKED
jgi:nucleotide-binding universal stress UspA family protein